MKGSQAVTSLHPRQRQGQSPQRRCTVWALGCCALYHELMNTMRHNLGGIWNITVSRQDHNTHVHISARVCSITWNSVLRRLLFQAFPHSPFEPLIPVERPHTINYPNTSVDHSCFETPLVLMSCQDFWWFTPAKVQNSKSENMHIYPRVGCLLRKTLSVLNEKWHFVFGSSTYSEWYLNKENRKKHLSLT